MQGSGWQVLFECKCLGNILIKKAAPDKSYCPDSFHSTFARLQGLVTGFLVPESPLAL